LIDERLTADLKEEIIHPPQRLFSAIILPQLHVQKHETIR
jgi:hypothetical protein